MLLSLKCLAAAGLAASMATGGAIATQASAEHRPMAVTIGAGVTAPSDVPAVAGIDNPAPVTAPADKAQDASEDATTTTSPPATSTTTITTTPPTSSPAPAPAPAPVVSVQTAGEAGTVTVSINGGVLTATDVHPNAGWTVDEQDLQGREIEVTFRNGLRRIDFKAEIEDGLLRTRVVSGTTEIGDDEPADQPETEAGDDHGGDGRDGVDDHSGPDRGGDHSGPGGGDDHSGDSGH
jgi:hypothetical protein